MPSEGSQTIHLNWIWRPFEAKKNPLIEFTVKVEIILLRHRTKRWSLIHRCIGPCPIHGCVSPFVRTLIFVFVIESLLWSYDRFISCVVLFQCMMFLEQIPTHEPANCPFQFLLRTASKQRLACLDGVVWSWSFRRTAWVQRVSHIIPPTLTTNQTSNFLSRNRT